MKRPISLIVVICMVMTVIPQLVFAAPAKASEATDKKVSLPDNYISYFDGVDLNRLLEGDTEQEEKIKENMGFMTDSLCTRKLRDAEMPDPDDETYYWWFKLKKGQSYDEHDFDVTQAFLETIADNGKKNGLQLNSGYNKNEPATWAGTCWVQGKDNVYHLSGLMFDKEKLASAFGYAVPSGDFCLGGTLAFTGIPYLESVWSKSNKFAYADFSDCTYLRIIWNIDDDYNDDVSLSGCKNLDTLIMTNCGLTKIDISGMSKLTQINVGDNDISYLDFSPCEKSIQAIELDNCRFSKIDVCNMPKLAILSVDNNMLTELDVSQNTELTRLSCSDNKIGFLDTSMHTKLGSLTAKNCDLRFLALPKGGNYARHFTVGNNKLTKIDLRGVTGLTAFNCDNNYIKELDLTDCPYLVSFVARNNLLERITFGQNPCFESIMVPNNRLTKLEIPKEAAMFNRLFCENNYITELDLSGFTFLYEFDCHNNNIKRLVFHEQSGFVKEEATKAFRIFDCTGNPIDEIIDFSFVKPKKENGRFNLYSQGGGYAVMRSEHDVVYEPAIKHTYRMYITAEEAQGCSFSGWYDGDTCVSTEKDILVTTIYGSNASSIESDFEYTELTAKFTGQKPQDYTGRYEAVPDEHMPTQSLITEGCTFNENDVIIMREFLEQTDGSGKKNGEKLMSTYDADKPETWSCCFWVEREGDAQLEALFLDNQLDNDTGKYVAEDRYTLTGTLSMAGAEHLSYVYLYGSEISSADFSGCKVLSHLMAGNNSRLSDVKLTGCNRLMALDLSDCCINTLDLTGKSELTYINVENNTLDTLDISKTPHLSCLICASNAITELATDKTPSLSSLNCENNKIKELSVWMCKDLGNLNCAGNGMEKLETIKGSEQQGMYAYLQVLNCSDNKLTSLYIAPTLMVCHTDNNSIATVNSANLIKEGNLMYLYISHNLLKKITFDTAFYMVGIDCSYNELETLNFVNENQLMTLDCSHNKLTKSALPTGLMENRVIYYDCSGNSITEVDLQKCGRNMYYLNISDNPVTHLKNAPLGYILRQPITLDDPMFYRIDIKVQGTGYIDYDLDTITAVGDDFTGFYTDGTKLTADKTLPTEGMQNCNITAKFGAFAMGDVNLDDTVNTGDAVVVLKHSAEMMQLTDEQKALADCNRDGNVNTGDAVLILKYAAGMISEF